MTQKLTLATRADRERVARLAARLPDVHDYFHGWRRPQPAGPGLPDNVLMFCRRDGRGLGSGITSYHHRHMLVVALAGSGQVEVDERRFALRPGGVLEVHPFSLHRYPSVRPRGLRWLFITFEAAFAPAGGGAAGTYRMTREVAGLLAMLVQWRLAGGERADGRWAQSMSLGLALLRERLLAAPAAESAGAGRLNGPGEAWVQPVLARMRDIDRPAPTVEQLAALAEISSSHLRALFRERFGVSLGAYSRRYRVLRAMGMVINEGLKIGQAADRCGFGSVYAFSRSARSVLGCSPRQYVQGARRIRR